MDKKLKNINIIKKHINNIKISNGKKSKEYIYLCFGCTDSYPCELKIESIEGVPDKPKECPWGSPRYPSKANWILVEE